MVSSQFGAILKEFESFFNCSLEPDTQNSCLIQLEMGIQVQIELGRDGFLLIGSRLGAVHMGRYRNELIRSALQSNETSRPSQGVLGFSPKLNELILFIKINPQLLSPYFIQTVLPPFIIKAKQWNDAIAKGEVPSIGSLASKKSPSGIFGLIS